MSENKKIFFTHISIDESRVDPVNPSAENDYVRVLGAQSFSVDIEFVTSGEPITKEDLLSMLIEKIGPIGESIELITKAD